MIRSPTEHELYGDAGDNDGGLDDYSLMSLGTSTIALGARGGAAGIWSEYMSPKLDLPGT